MKWAITCSVDAVSIDYEQEIEGAKEPGFWECEEIARLHGCEYWSLEAVTA